MPTDNTITKARHACLAVMRQRSRNEWIDTLEAIRVCVMKRDDKGRPRIAALLGRSDRTIAIFFFLYISELTKIYGSRRAEGHSPFFIPDPYAEHSDFGEYRLGLLPAFYMDCFELVEELGRCPSRDRQSTPSASELAAQLALLAKPKFEALADKIAEEQQAGFGPARKKILDDQRDLTLELMEILFCANDNDDLKLIHKLRVFLFHQIEWDRKYIPTESVITGQLARVRSLMGDCCLEHHYGTSKLPSQDPSESD